MDAARESVQLTKMRYRVETGPAADEPWRTVYLFHPDYTTMPDEFTAGVML